MNKKPTLVSLFSGAGGMDLGFKLSGYEILWANDFNKDAVYTYSRNIGEHIVYGSITEIDKNTIPKNPDVIIGGFPCQGFSISNTKRNMDDKRNFLYKELLESVDVLRPKIFVAENVKGLLSMCNRQVIKMIVKDFEDLGYKVDYKLLNASDYGVPQSRERVIIMGNNIGVDNIFPEKTHGDELLPKRTVEESIGYLQYVPLNSSSFVLEGRNIHNHIAYTNVSDKFFARKHPVSQSDICDYLKYWRSKRKISTAKIDEILGYRHTAGHWFRKDSSGSIPTPSDWIKLKEILQFDNKFDKEVTELIEKEITFDQSLRIVNWDRPSDTITASTPEIHINKQRRLSVRECAILQTFPDDFIFHGSLSSQHRQVGNAVPVDLAKVIANSTIQMLSELHNT